MSKLRERLQAKLAERATKKIEDDVDPEFAQERKRRIAAIDGENDLKKLRAVSGTLDTVVLNYAIENLSEIEVGCWAAILRSSSLEILEKAVARLKLIASDEFITTTFVAINNPSISDKLFDEIIDIAITNKLLDELFSALTAKSLGAAVSRKLAKVFYEGSVLPSENRLTVANLPFYVNLIFLMVSKKPYNLVYVYHTFSLCFRFFQEWAENTKDRRAIFEIGSLLICLVPTLVAEKYSIGSVPELVTLLRFLDTQEIKG